MDGEFLVCYRSEESHHEESEGEITMTNNMENLQRGHLHPRAVHGGHKMGRTGNTLLSLDSWQDQDYPSLILRSKNA